jgi:hypothetical protein
MKTFKKYLETLKEYSFKKEKKEAKKVYPSYDSVSIKWENKEDNEDLKDFIEMLKSYVDEATIIFDKGKDKTEIKKRINNLKKINQEIKDKIILRKDLIKNGEEQKDFQFLLDITDENLSYLTKNGIKKKDLKGNLKDLSGRLTKHYKEKFRVKNPFDSIPANEKRAKRVFNSLSENDKIELLKYSLEEFRRDRVIRRVKSLNSPKYKDFHQETQIAILKNIKKWFDEKKKGKDINIKSLVLKTINRFLIKIISNWVKLILSIYLENNHPSPPLGIEAGSIKLEDPLEEETSIVFQTKKIQYLDKLIGKELEGSFYPNIKNPIEKMESIYKKWMRSDQRHDWVQFWLKRLYRSEKSPKEQKSMMENMESAYLIGKFLRRSSFIFKEGFKEKWDKYRELFKDNNPQILFYPKSPSLNMRKKIFLKPKENFWDDDYLEKIKEITKKYFDISNMSITHYTASFWLGKEAKIVKKEGISFKRILTDINSLNFRSAIFPDQEKTETEIKVKGRNITLHRSYLNQIRNEIRRIIKKNEERVSESIEREEGYYLSYEEEIKRLKEKSEEMEDKLYTLESKRDSKLYSDEAQSGYMSIACMDASKILMISAIKTDIEVENPIKVSINLKDFLNIINTQNNNPKKLEIKFDPAKIKVIQRGVKSKIKVIKTLKCLEEVDASVSQEQLGGLIDLNYPSVFSTSKPYWEDLFYEMDGTYSNVLKIIIEREGVYFRSNGQIGSGEFLIKKKEKFDFDVDKLQQISGIGSAKIVKLRKNGYKTVRDVFETSPKKLKEIKRFGDKVVEDLINGIEKMDDTVSIDMKENIEKVSSVYSLEYLRKMDNALDLLENEDKILLYLKKDYPTKLEARFKSLDIDFLLFLAPRVEEVEDEDIDF